MANTFEVSEYLDYPDFSESGKLSEYKAYINVEDKIAKLVRISEM